jgi:hypothetical protein
MFGRLILITSLVAVAQSAQATTMIPLDLKALTERADRVVYATVESTEAHWTSSHDAIYTDVKLRVQRSFKGAAQPGELVTVRREGGTVGTIGMKVFGAPQFTPGEEVVVFVEPRGGANWVVGMAQGKLRVITRADGAKLAATAEVGAIHFTGPSLVAKPQLLDELERNIRTYVKAGR